MGRVKIDNKVKINEPKKRQVTFIKRSKGAIKKLLELHHLCGAQIFTVIMSDTGKITVVNAGSSPSDLIAKYNYLKNNNQIFKEFTDLDQLKKEDVNKQPKKTCEFYLNGDYNKLILEKEPFELALDNEENESLNCMDDFLKEKLI